MLVLLNLGWPSDDDGDGFHCTPTMLRVIVCRPWVGAVGERKSKLTDNSRTPAGTSTWKA